MRIQIGKGGVHGVLVMAVAWLMSLAAADDHSVQEQARRIVDAVELLARPGQR